MIADRGSISQGDFDALADLFLGAGATPAAQPPAPAASAPGRPAGTAVPTLTTPSDLALPRTRPGPAVEVLLLAHVPVMAASWATQYARARVEGGSGPVALLRLAEDRARVEVVGAGGLAAATELAMGIAEARRHASTMIVFPAPELNSDELVSNCGAITLMTTPDEAGVVAAYTILKHLAAVCEAGTIGGPKPIRLVMLGGDAARSQAASVRLREAASSFLHAHLDDRLVIERLSGGLPPTVLFDGPWIGSAAGLMHDLTAAVQATTPPASGPVASAAVEPAGAASPLIEPAGMPGAPSRDVLEAVLGRGSPAPSAPAPATLPPSAPASAPASPTSPAPVTPARRSVEAVESVDGVDLIRLLPGVQALPARCPHAENVQLGVDGEGRLHAAVSAVQGAEAGCVASLMTAGAWAEVNRRVLGLLAGPGAGPIGDGAAVLHLFTHRPVGCRPLLDTGLKVHALAAAREAGCVSIELN